MKLKILLLLFLSQVFLSAQIDTTDFFPMQTGNYWEYVAFTINGPEYISISVIGDTLMPNGNVYKAFAEKRFYNPNYYSYVWFFRKDSNKVYFAYPYAGCTNQESIYLDFYSPDSTVWEVCGGGPSGNARGIARTFYDYTYYNFLQKPLETKLFYDAYIDSADTIWNPSDGSIPIWIAKGIGIVRELIPLDGDYRLQGAIINGVRFGIITDVEDDNQIIPNKFVLYQNYPNPFNPSTEIGYSLKEDGIVVIKVFDVLGKEVAVLKNKYETAGNHIVNFNAANLPSGIYFYRITAGKFHRTKKMVLLR